MLIEWVKEGHLWDALFFHRCIFLRLNCLFVIPMPWGTCILWPVSLSSIHSLGLISLSCFLKMEILKPLFIIKVAHAYFEKNLDIRKNGRESTPYHWKGHGHGWVAVSLTFPNLLPFGSFLTLWNASVCSVDALFAQTLWTFLSPQGNVHGNSILERSGQCPRASVPWERVFLVLFLPALLDRM